MFVELGAFYSEKESYNQRVENLKAQITDPKLLERNIEEERLKFKGITRKYLAPALAVIKEMFGVDYSLYKVGRDVDANFKTIETTVHKTQTEIAEEMNAFVSKANDMQLDEYKANRLNIAITVIMSYVDDAAITEDENKAFYLNHSKVVASSLELPVTKKEDVPQQDANQPAPQTQSIQNPVEPVYNPYANQPVDLNNQMNNNVSSGKETLVDPFASIYNGTATSSNEPVQQSLDSLTNNNQYQPPQTELYQMPQATTPLINSQPVNNFNSINNSMTGDINNMNNNIPVNNNFQMTGDINNTNNNIPVNNNFQTPNTNIFGLPTQVEQQPTPQPSINNSGSFAPVVPVVPAPQSIFQPSEPMNSVQPVQQPVQQAGMDMSQLLYSSTSQQSPQPVNNPINTQFVAPQPFNQQPSQNTMFNAQQGQPLYNQPMNSQQESVAPNNNRQNNGGFVTEKNAIVMQILAALLIPILVGISSAIVYFVFDLEIIQKFIADMPPALISFALCLIIATICLILSGPIIALGRKCTGYLERFLIAPALLSIPVLRFMSEMVPKIEIKDAEMALNVVAILALSAMIYYIFVTLMFVRGFVNSSSNQTSRSPSWSIFDKLGMLCVVYMIMIPAVYVVCMLIGVDLEFMGKIAEVIYFTNNETIYPYMDKIFLIGAPIVAGLGMITRTVILFNSGRKK